jgi:type IV pilus assembly protein PilE
VTRRLRAPTCRRSLRGVTLIELMIVVVVVAILGTVAVPSYRQYMIRTYRTEAKSALLQIHANQERHYLQHLTYTADLAALGFPGGRSELGVYDLAIGTSDGLTLDFVATATPSSAGGSNGVRMTDDLECTQFSIDSRGARRATPDPQQRCW